jgi:glycosyltransferase involved in cell wall biosynthesis
MLNVQSQADRLIPRPASLTRNSDHAGAKILFLIDEMVSITAGGTERQLLQLVDICKRNGVAPQICVLRRTSWLTSEVAGCPVKHFQLETVFSWSGFWSVLHLVSWICRQQADIMQTFFSEANLIGPCIARLAGIPIVFGTRRNMNHPRTDGPNRFGLWLQTVVNRLVQQIIANSVAVQERIISSEGVPREKMCVVYNGIDLAAMQPAPHLRAAARTTLGIAHDEILVGNVSGLRKIKGVQLFVNAAAAAYKADPRLRFVLIGAGELQAQLEASIRSYGLEQVITLAGAIDDVRPYLAAFDIAVLCSHAEGFSNSLLEYMASGCAIIATDVGGNAEALGSSGLLVPDNAEALTDAIAVLADAETRQRYASAALRQVQNFDVAIAQQRMAEIYAHYLSQKISKQSRIAQTLAHLVFSPLRADEI